jgi:hypothetical protein
VRQLLVTANVSSTAILVTLMIEALISSNRRVLKRATPRNISEDGILRSPLRENLNSYFNLCSLCMFIVSGQCVHSAISLGTSFDIHHHHTIQYYILGSFLYHRKENSNLVRFEVFRVVIMQSAVSWDVTPLSSCKNQRFRGDAFLRNVDSYKSYTASHPRRRHSLMLLVATPVF